MGKRSKSKRRSAAAAATAEDDDASARDVSAAVAVDGPTVPDDDDDDGSEPGRTWNDARSSLHEDLLPLISSPEEMLTTLLLEEERDGDDGDGGDEKGREVGRGRQARHRLLRTSARLFRYIERLASVQERLRDAQKRKKLGGFDDDGGEEKMDDDDNDDLPEDDDVEPCTLSGIPSLYTGQDAVGGIEGEAMAMAAVDAETVWGQVDLQNGTLLPLLKKSIRRLGRRASADEGGKKYDDDDMIRILDAGAMGDNDDDDESDDESDGDMMSEGSVASDLDRDNDDDDEDEGGEDSDEGSEARRIRERMEKAMADMDGDDDDEEEEEDVINSKEQRLREPASEAATLEEEDPTREEMRDGFFDLHEMEAFADEEEEMLPDDAYGEEELLPEDDKEKKKQRKKGVLPHLRDRMGEDSDGDDDDDEEGFDDDEDEDDDPLSKRFQPTTIRRKKYRADDEVEALYKLYDDGQSDNEGFDDSDDEEKGGDADASAMTAADLFGKPNEKLIKSYKTKHDKGKNVKHGKVGMGKAKGGNNDKKDNTKKKKTASFDKDFDDDDADSWDNHNFEEDGMDWKEDGKGEVDSEEGGSGSEEDREDDDIEEEVEDMAENEKLSAHAIQSQKLQEQTLRLEHELIAEKPWKMMGEAKGTDRAPDSLLDSTPEFEVAFKPPPILTAEHTADIETMIKKRVLEEDWDDVVPRELPDIGVKRGGGDAPEVSQEKSKLGLGELYEREYLKKTSGYDRDAHEKQTEEDAAKDEMKRLFANLCSQLDALSNYHFAPRPVADEADVQNRSEDVPAIAMEEVLPLHVSTSRGKAPEEVYGAGKGKKSVLKGDSELDQAERKRIRSGKKAARRKERKQKHADEKLISKLQPGLGLNNPYEKRKLREELQMARASGKVVVASDDKATWEDEAAASKEYRTSTKFFQKMQENVDSMVHGDGDGDGGGRAKKKRKGVEAGQSSSVYRL